LRGKRRTDRSEEKHNGSWESGLALCSTVDLSDPAATHAPMRIDSRYLEYLVCNHVAVIMAM
jgi:hypothetical protein